MLEFCKSLQKQDIMDIPEVRALREQNKQSLSLYPVQGNFHRLRSIQDTVNSRISGPSYAHSKPESHLSVVSKISRKHLRGSIVSNTSTFIVKEPEYLAFEEEGAH